MFCLNEFYRRKTITAQSCCLDPGNVLMNELELYAVSHSHALLALLVLDQKLCECVSYADVLRFFQVLLSYPESVNKALLSHYAQASQLFSRSLEHTHIPKTLLTNTFPGRDTNIFISQPNTLPAA